MSSLSHDDDNFDSAPDCRKDASILRHLDTQKRHDWMEFRVQNRRNTQLNEDQQTLEQACGWAVEYEAQSVVGSYSCEPPLASDYGMMERSGEEIYDDDSKRLL